MGSYQVLEGLPPNGPLALGFPEAWAEKGQEGFVIEFLKSDGRKWTGNFEGNAGAVFPHPDGLSLLVVAGGPMYVVNIDECSVDVLDGHAEGVHQIIGCQDLLIELSGVCLARLGGGGFVWKTSRISWDGFRGVSTANGVISGESWSPIQDKWIPFRVDLASGALSGGSYPEDMEC